MKSRYITWEIILGGLVLTVLAFYVVNNPRADNNHDDFSFSDPLSAPRPAQPSDDLSEPAERPDPPEPPPTELELRDLENLESLKQLKQLEEIRNIKELKMKLRDLSELFHKEQLQQALENIDRELSKLEESEIQVQFNDDPKITIHKKYKTPVGNWTQVKSGDYVYRSDFTVDQLDQLNFSMSAGQFNIVGGNRDHPHISLRASGNIDSPEQLDRQVDIDVNQSGGQTGINVDNRGNSGFYSQLNIEATLFIPSDTRVIAKTNGGHITASDLSNAAILSTSGGHITLEKIHGKTKVETKGGHITIKKSGGNLTAQTSGGHIKISGFDGSANAHTSGGHLQFETIKGSISGSTSGGNIKAFIADLDGDIKLNTSAGNINLRLPLNTEANIWLKGMNTSIDDAFNFTGNSKNGMIKGTLKPESSQTSSEDLPTVRASCSFGNVSLSPYER